MRAHPLPGGASRLTGAGAPDRRRRHGRQRVQDQHKGGWICRFILFHQKRHPRDMAEAEVAAFLTSLAQRASVIASTQSQALAALFLYKAVLERPLGCVEGVVHAKRPQRLPVVLTPDEVRDLLEKLKGTSWLVATLLYGSGLRVREALTLRIKDIDLESRAYTFGTARVGATGER
jgi:integrase